MIDSSARDRGAVACALIALVAGVLWPASAAAGSRDNRCETWSERYTVLVETRDGAIFAKGRARSAPPPTYGCLFSTQRARRLADALPNGMTMDGRYAAYFTFVDDNFQTLGHLGVSDLRIGRVVSRAGVHPTVTSDLATRYCGTQEGPVVLRGDGAVAFAGGIILDECNGSPRRIHWEISTVAAPGERATFLDMGEGIDPRSLAKSADERTVVWTHDGAARNAQLGR